MTNGDPEVRMKAPKARQGEVSGHMRYVLGIGVALAVVALLGAWWYYFG